MKYLLLKRTVGLWRFKKWQDIRLFLGMCCVVILLADTFSHGPIMIHLRHGNLDLVMLPKLSLIV